MARAHRILEVPVTVLHPVREGWGVAIVVIHGGEHEARVVELDGCVVRIAPDTIAVIGGEPCVRNEAFGAMWFPTANFRPDLPAVADDQHDARSHWFATQAEAVAHLAAVLDDWARPPIWRNFVVMT